MSTWLEIVIRSIAGALLVAHVGGCAVSETRVTSNVAVTRREGWYVLKLSGTPREIGRTYGRAMPGVIDDTIKAVQLSLTHEADGDEKGHDWAWYRSAAKSMCEPYLPEEYREELLGISEGLAERGVRYDLTDLVAYNAYEELSDNYDWWEKQQKSGGTPAPQGEKHEHCSAFIATGNATRDGKIVAGHSTWDGYLTGQRTNAIVEITPLRGHRFVMETMPGMIHSGTDWSINDVGIILTETTIGGFEGFDPKGVPEFVRARQAQQYAESLDDVYRWLVHKNNGGYANTWLMGDIKTNEIGKLELGLKNVIFHRSTQGAYSGANFPEDPKFIVEECGGEAPDANDGTQTRRVRWAQLLKANVGAVDAELAKLFLGDTVDVRTGEVGAFGGSICGRGDLKPGEHGHVGASGAVNAKVTTADLASALSFWARMGFPDGSTFDAKAYLDGPGKRDEWQRGMLRDIPKQEWVLIKP